MTRHEKILSTVSRSAELVVVGEGLEAARRHIPAKACPHSGRLRDLWQAGHASWEPRGTLAGAGEETSPSAPAGRAEPPTGGRPVGPYPAHGCAPESKGARP